MNSQHRPEYSILVPVFLVAAAWGIMSGCSDRAAELVPKLPELSTTPEALSAALSSALERADDRADLIRLYASNNSSPLWVDVHGLTGRGEQAIAALRGAPIRGLHSEDYPITMGAVDSAEGLAETEVSLSRSFLQFTSDLRWGRHNPGVYAPKSGNLSELVLNVATNPDGFEAGLQKLDPPFDEFKRLSTALAQYRRSGTPEEIATIELTLERWRWLPREFRRGPILVNIPEFMVRVFDDQLQTVMTMRAIVGKPTNKTPLLSGEISHLIFGPYWNVPPSILHKEILPDIVKDRSYLKKNSFEVQTQQGDVVSTGEVTNEILAGLRSDRYKIRQIPGPKNALGRVKLMFPNNEHVYLHDTNSRNLFQKTVRALSHGCMRIEKPQELAEWALRNDTAWPKNRILEALEQTHEQQVNLKQRIPVFIVYHTATVNEAGEVTFHKDIYGHDSVQ